MARSEAPLAVELCGVTKAFGPLVANRDVSFKVRKGTVHALVGENGAGKSTCMKMLYGLYRPDAGEILIHGQKRHWKTPRDAIAAGLGMVHQHFMLAGPYSGLDNIILGAEPAKGFFSALPRVLRPIDREAARRRLTELAAAYQFQVDLDRPVQTLPVGVQQRLEILKLLYRDVDTLILDEPTAVLTPQEVDELFQNLQRLRAEGRTIIIITHKLREVLRFADDVTVLRRGEVVGGGPVQGLTEPLLAEMMVGRAVQLTAAVPPPPVPGAAALRLSNVTLGEKGEKPRLAALSLEVRQGEIVGVAGIEGNGQTELLRLVIEPRTFFTGHERRRHLTAHGELAILGADARRAVPRQVRDLGVGIVPEDRHHQGLLLGYDLTRNFLLGLQRLAAFARFGLIRWRPLQSRLKAAIADFDIRPADPKALSGSLSGGNQQKLIIARELERRPRLLVCAQPTRGVDVGSIEFIHARLLAARTAGMAVLLVSSSLEEILALSDRIVVLYEGRIAASFRRGEADEALLGRFMGGAHG